MRVATAHPLVDAAHPGDGGLGVLDGAERRGGEEVRGALQAAPRVALSSFHLFQHIIRGDPPVAPDNQKP
jgi:hypothetical protein